MEIEMRKTEKWNRVASLRAQTSDHFSRVAESAQKRRDASPLKAVMDDLQSGKLTVEQATQMVANMQAESRRLDEERRAAAEAARKAEWDAWQEGLKSLGLNKAQQ
jgi:DUF1009 family protein